ncbi:hypothetical protein COL5a_009845 [Colletotrichum fioriniae]|uniref:uncharacterized protein n=1 Tax=Colletotrichum fioriniae TaxID=710243 RepID=UPI002300CBCE|nr:uncharacterized protein COL516b_010614 [Colletotrichum fioriniae]KAJ0297566.1 hypothetical protein COL516b_010614 [Colletotrichum fioriniae]KAJ0320215.1 hypothetical protein COL5a_009845 [Colletotrichum fioriniae]KAJ3940051.1 hypothetical protein N0V96_010050 [Colletotrichum fioriniae]
MANIFRQAISWLYTTLAVSILGSWTLLILGGVGLTAVDSNPGLLQLIAFPSLLTFLVAKLIVAASPSTALQQSQANARNAIAAAPAGGGNLATWLATADYGSPHGALVLFLFSVTWLLHLARVVFALFLVVLMGAFFVFASSLDAADKEDKEAGGEGLFSDDDGARKNFTTALAEFEEQAGIGLGDYLVDNPWVVFQVFVALWGMMNLLLMYLTVYAFGALKKVLTTPLEAWARGGQEAAAAPALAAGGSPAAETRAPVVVVEKERVVVPAEAQPAN